MKHFYLLILLVGGFSYGQYYPCDEFGLPNSFVALDACSVRIEVMSANPPTAFYCGDAQGWTTSIPFGTSAQYMKANGSFGTFSTDVNALISGKFSGLTSQYVRGDGSFASLPTIPTNTNQLTNGAGFLSSVTAGMVITALGYTPLANEVDGSTTNELQTLSFTSPNLSISGGNSVSLDSLMPTQTTSSVTRSLNTSFRPSTTLPARVNYSVTSTIALTLALSNGSVNIYLETSPNNSAWTTVCQTGFSRSLSVAVALNDTNTGNLYADVPAGYYVRIRTAGTGGGLTSSVANVTFTAGQETF